MTSEDYTQRFTGKADSYSKYRPSYPERVLSVLKEKTSFDSTKIVADVGSGTGILSRLFLENGNTVYAIEPNEDMRSKAELALARFPNFHSVKGSAEDTTLEERSVDLITVAQALHWFDPAKSWKEFRRIIRQRQDEEEYGGGWLCVLYNDRKESERVMKDYESLINKHAKNRPRMERIEGDMLSRFFPSWSYEKISLPNEQVLDFEGLVGRVASASYMPQPGAQEFADVEKGLKQDIFEKYQREGRITLFYETNIFLGKLSPSS